jgi:1-aminocyclopropane-1-carboxylate deaminase/D-cysteine desulfhydrase-like pyridoxal-dependent ACC family enzyme
MPAPIGMSPLHRLPGLSRLLSLDLWVKRDDLLPMPGGGNKIRKMHAIMAGVRADGYTALVSTGGVQSNHARAVALTAAAEGLRCTLVLHGVPGEPVAGRGNALLARLAGANVTVVAAQDVAATLEHVMDNLRAAGERPVLIPGGGHCVAGTTAYVKAFDESFRQMSAHSWCPEQIILASGTGATQAGLAVGVQRHGLAARVTGISVARRNPRGGQAVRDAITDYLEYHGYAPSHIDVDFRDGWIGEGYERATGVVLDAIALAASADGLVLDPTYTGKAFTALLDMARSGELPPGSRVLFWHTGGLLNLMASNYFTESII